jgi:hypothetical protein
VLRLSSGEKLADPGLRGSNNKGARFGWSIAKAGDLNNDEIEGMELNASCCQVCMHLNIKESLTNHHSYHKRTSYCIPKVICYLSVFFIPSDFIVGAPQDLPDLDNDGVGNGAIYIYHGNRKGIFENYQQV